MTDHPAEVRTMMRFDHRAAAHKALDALLDRYVYALASEHAAEAERYGRMLKQGGISHLTTGDLQYTERHWPALSPFSVWNLIVRGSDLLAGSIRGGYEQRHGAMNEREDPTQGKVKSEAAHGEAQPVGR